MRYADALDLDNEKFRRLTGVKKTTFQEMVRLPDEAQTRKKAKGGRPHKLTVPEMLLMTLEYLREYRTYCHIGASYGISESNAYPAIRWVEGTLAKSRVFALPGRKALAKGSHAIDAILVDATETPIERPPKSKNGTTRARRSGTR